MTAPGYTLVAMYRALRQGLVLRVSKGHTEPSTSLWPAFCTASTMAGLNQPSWLHTGLNHLVQVLPADAGGEGAWGAQSLSLLPPLGARAAARALDRILWVSSTWCVICLAENSWVGWWCLEQRRWNRAGGAVQWW